MGSEQSTSSGGAGKTSSSASADPLYSLSRQDIIGAGVTSPTTERQESICSDVEVPYVSYTVNKPIGGDSPKKKKATLSSASTGSGAGGAIKKRSFLGSRLAQSAHNTLVFVKDGEPLQQPIPEPHQRDPELARLDDIPSFLPIMRASLSVGTAKADPDILERLDFRGLLSLCQRSENHLRLCAVTVSTEQAEIGRMVRETDSRIASLTQVMSEKQKAHAKHVERLSRVDDMSKCVARCHLLLNENIEQIEALNNMLPAEDRLEPFVWTTG